nr:puromycin-sensitive aminopeptidase-like isoform X2 [Tanacetum cinerariifolium]
MRCVLKRDGKEGCFEKGHKLMKIDKYKGTCVQNLFGLMVPALLRYKTLDIYLCQTGSAYQKAKKCERGCGSNAIFVFVSSSNVGALEWLVIIAAMETGVGALLVSDGTDLELISVAINGNHLMEGGFQVAPRHFILK